MNKSQRTNQGRYRIVFGLGIFCVLAAALYTACKRPLDVWSCDIGSESTVMTTPKTGDAKFMKDKILSGADGHMILFDQDGTVYREFADIPLNWLSVYEPENLVVAASWKKELRLVALNDDWTVKRNEIIPVPRKADTLMIDPTLIKVKRTYILTWVEIDGSINNGDAQAQNGIYTVKCMKSKNLSDWKAAPDILSYQKNIEDADMIFKNKTLYYFFEKEEYDKGPSSINVMMSKDYGRSWHSETELLAPVADHELASIEAKKNRFVLYYSSDADSPGTSYTGAKIYQASFARDFKRKDNRRVDIGEDKGILLYDTKKAADGRYYLYARDYCKENDLVWTFLRY